MATISGLGGPVSGRFAFRYDVPDTSTNGDYIGIDTVAVNARRVAAVPEPATWTMLGIGLAGLDIRHRRAARRVVVYVVRGTNHETTTVGLALDAATHQRSTDEAEQKRLETVDVEDGRAWCFLIAAATGGALYSMTARTASTSPVRRCRPPQQAAAVKPPVASSRKRRQLRRLAATQAGATLLAAPRTSSIRSPRSLTLRARKRCRRSCCRRRHRGELPPTGAHRRRQRCARPATDRRADDVHVATKNADGKVSVEHAEGKTEALREGPRRVRWRHKAGKGRTMFGNRHLTPPSRGRCRSDAGRTGGLAHQRSCGGHHHDCERRPGRRRFQRPHGGGPGRRKHRARRSASSASTPSRRRPTSGAPRSPARSPSGCSPRGKP